MPTAEGDSGQVDGGRLTAGSSGGAAPAQRPAASPSSVDRGIRIAAHPAHAHGTEWAPAVAASYPKPGPQPMHSPSRPPTAGRAGASGNEGMLGKLLGWLGDDGFSPFGSGGGRMGRAPSGGAPDFTALTEDPDQRRRRQQQTQQHLNSQRKAIAEERWRSECLAVARGRRLGHVADMKLVWVSAATHRSGAAVLVIVGAHFRKHLASLEDILLYTVLEFEKLAGRPFVVCFFNADAPMTALPDTVWFQELHAALPPRHREALRAVYLVHPRSHWAATRGWLYILRSQEAAVYGKVQLVNNLDAMLATEFDAGLRREVPQLVLDYVGRHPGAA